VAALLNLDRNLSDLAVEVDVVAVIVRMAEHHRVEIVN